MEWMSPMDASFLHIENEVTHMHIGSVGIFEGPPPGPDDIPEAIAAHLPLVPRYRQRVRFVPLALGRPLWVDDPHFKLDYHVRRTALPAPGSEKQLRRTAARIFAQHLDRTKPLWEIWLVEGLSRSRWALLSKVHHCMVDGVSASDLMSVMFETDGARAAPVTRRAPAWEPEPEPGDAALAVRTLVRRTLNPSEQLRSVRAATRAPRATVGAARDLLAGVTSAARVMRPTDSTSLTGPVGPHRTWSCAQLRLSDVKAVRAVLGGTVNDVVLAIVSGGLRDLLQSRGEHLRNVGHSQAYPVGLSQERI